MATRKEQAGRIAKTVVRRDNRFSFYIVYMSVIGHADMGRLDIAKEAEMIAFILKQDPEEYE